MFVIVEVPVHRQSQKSIILRSQPLPQLVVRRQIDHRLSAPINPHVRIVIGIQPVALMIEYIALDHRRPPRRHPTMLRPQPVIDGVIYAANINPVDEAGDAHKPRTHILIGADVVEMESIPAHFKLVCRSRVMIAISKIPGAEGIKVVFASSLQIRGIQPQQIARTRNRLTLHSPVGMELEARVNAPQAVVFARRRTLPVREYRTHARLPENIPAYPRNGEIRSIAGEGIRAHNRSQRTKIRHREARRSIIRRHHTQRIRPCLPGQSNPCRRIFYVSREEQVDRRAEIIFVLQKEWTLLRKINFKPLIHRDLRILRLHLAEIRIRGQVQNKTILNHKLRVSPKLPLRYGILEVRIVRIPLIERSKSAHDSVGDQLDVTSRRNSFQAVKRRRLSEPALYLVRNLRPEGIFTLARDAAVQNDSPLLQLFRRKP